MLKFFRDLFGAAPPQPAPQLVVDRGDRGGPDPAPPPSDHPAGVRIVSFSDLRVEPGKLRDLTSGRSSSNHVRLAALPLPGAAEADPPPGNWASILLDGALLSPFRMAPGDLVTGHPGGRLQSGEAGALLLLDLSVGTQEPQGPRKIASDDLVGHGIKGIAGVRVLHRCGVRSLLRLGPPPGARWVMKGVRGFALFGGKLLLIDAGEPRTIHAGSIAIMDDPSVPIYLQAGNDSAVGLAVAFPDVIVALG